MGRTLRRPASPPASGGSDAWKCTEVHGFGRRPRGFRSPRGRGRFPKLPKTSRFGRKSGRFVGGREREANGETKPIEAARIVAGVRETRKCSRGERAPARNEANGSCSAGRGTLRKQWDRRQMETACRWRRRDTERVGCPCSRGVSHAVSRPSVAPHTRCAAIISALRCGG